jgi:hypothetical protein
VARPRCAGARALSLAASAQASGSYSFICTSTTTSNVIATGAFITAANASALGYDLIDTIQLNAIVDSSASAHHGCARLATHHSGRN